MDVEEAKIEENPEVKIIEVIGEMRENSEGIVLLGYDLSHEYGR